MALQAAFLPSALTVHKEAKFIKDSSFAGISLAGHAKAESVAPLRSKKPVVIRAQSTAVAAPGLTRSALDGKKVLRKGVVIVTGASSLSSGLVSRSSSVLSSTTGWAMLASPFSSSLTSDSASAPLNM